MKFSFVNKGWRNYGRKNRLAKSTPGLHLGDADREEVLRLRQRISGLATTFSSNLVEDNTELAFSDCDLDGVPGDLIESFEKVRTSLKKYFLGEVRVFFL
jgi:Zn-dependent oligopeptidase